MFRPTIALRLRNTHTNVHNDMTGAYAKYFLKVN